MDKEKFLQSGLLEQYVLGLTSKEESEKVERYADAFPEIKAEIELMRQAIGEYARQHTSLHPKVLRARVKNDGGGLPWAKWASKAAIALLFTLSLYFYRLKVAAEREYQSLSVECQALQQDCTRQLAEQEKLQKLYAFLNHEHTIPIRLASTGLVAGAEAVAYFNGGQKKVYISPTHLPEPPPGKAYQVWADVDGKMISLGLIDSHLKQLQPVAFVEGAKSFNITLEPEGGSEEPSVNMLYVNARLWF